MVNWRRCGEGGGGRGPGMSGWWVRRVRGEDNEDRKDIRQSSNDCKSMGGSIKLGTYQQVQS